MDQSMRLSTLARRESTQRETKHLVPKVRRPLPQDKSKDRQVQREPNAQYRQHRSHGQLTIFQSFGFPLAKPEPVAQQVR